MFEFLKRHRRMRFSALADAWLEDSQGRVKSSTLSNYRVLTRKHLLPVFGSMYVRDITDEQVAAYLAGLRDGNLAVSTRRSIQLVLQMILRYGEEQDICGPIRFPNLPPMPRGSVSALTDKEFTKLELWLKENLDTCHMGILLCMYTGMRIGEVCALRWGDVDLEEGTVTVGRTLQRIADEDGSHILIDTPKSRNSLRVIPLPRQLLSAMKPFAAGHEDYLLTGDGHYMEPRHLQRRFRRCLEQAGVRLVKYHALRHTFATRCVALTLDPKTLSYILGHANVSTTMSVYVHPSREQIRGFMERLPDTKMA